MLKFNLGLISILGASLFSSNIMAMEQQYISSGITITYELHPHKAETFSNPFFLTINALCALRTKESNADLRIKGLAGVSSVNDHPINLGELSISVKQNDSIRITAKPQASVEITNQGESLVTAVCKTV